MKYCFPNFFVNFWQHFSVNLFSIFGKTEVSLESTCTFLQGYQDCVRGLPSSLSLSTYLCVCVCDCVCDCVCVCVCVFWIDISELVVYGGDGGDYFPPGFQNYFLFPLSTSLFFLFFDDIPPPCNGYKAAPIFSSLSNVYVCVCVCS